MASRNNNDLLSQEFLPLSEEEKALIMGTLLGDAHLQKRGNSFRLKITHGINQKSYVYWKHKKLERLCLTTQAPKVETDKKGFQFVTFYTSSGKWLTEMYNLFYIKKDENSRPVKTITKKLIDSLPMHPMVLAVLFMDDGSVRNDCFSGKIATQGFTKEESHLLCEYLKKWGIEGKVVAHKVSKNQYYISLPRLTFNMLVSAIRPIVQEIPEMSYKLNDLNKTP
jgi:hypothetical protein